MPDVRILSVLAACKDIADVSASPMISQEQLLTILAACATDQAARKDLLSLLYGTIEIAERVDAAHRDGLPTRQGGPLVARTPRTSTGLERTLLETVAAFSGGAKRS